MGVNREELRQLYWGGATPDFTTDNLCFRFMAGCDFTDGLIKYDPEGAKKLLAEAGYANGLDLGAVLTTEKLHSLPSAVADDALTMIATRSADVMVELTPTNLESGEPATSHITAALNRGMHVITANKGPAALHLTALRALAAQKGLFLGIEGTVMAGTPSLRLGWSSLAGADITRVRGIVNGTTNYILTQMEQGLDYAAALADAQKIGYAEADPTGDVEGHDAAGKAAILANVLMNAGMRPSDVAA